MDGSVTVMKQKILEASEEAIAKKQQQKEGNPNGSKVSYMNWQYQISWEEGASASSLTTFEHETF